MKWDYNGTTGLANNDNEIFFVFFVYFFFGEYAEKTWSQIAYQSGSFSSSNLKVSIVFHGIQEKKKKKTLHQFVNTPTDSSEPKVSIENRIFRWGSCFLRDLSFSSLQLFHIFPTNFLKWMIIRN